MVRDKDSVSFARKAMLQCGLGLKNGVWKISLLKPELQGIIRENRSHFDGEPVPTLGADVKIVVMMNKSRMSFYFVGPYESQHFWPAAKLLEHSVCCKHKLLFIP